MNQYHNHNLTVMEIIEELIRLAKELMGDVVLTKLAKDITDKLRKSATIDWQYKEAVKAKMRILVRRMLMMYKYPPDAQPEAIEYVLEQAEAIAGDF